MRRDRSRERQDHSSLSNVREAWARHAVLRWRIDFEAKRISGSVRYEVESAAGARRFVVDTSGGLEISAARVDGAAVAVSWGASRGALGVAASVPLVGSARRHSVEFEYSTGRGCTATQWLAANGKPFLFTQCQAIHCRSLIPIQDSPGQKVTWEAAVEAPEWCEVLMSGLRGGSRGEWRQPRPVSSYLIALVAGDLVSREISARCRVWAEPGAADAARDDFSEAEAFLRSAEAICEMPYAWERYDLVCLPASFPYGGMENANLTFVTPTLLTGDKSLATVVAHEIAHSWTGNLVTAKTWAHFWLNEGWTRWLERQIKADVSGDRGYVDFDVARGREELEALCRSGYEHTSLVPDLSGGIDPDDAFSIVPYEKGSNLLHYLESLAGSRAFLGFFRRYLRAFSNDPLTSDQFRHFFAADFPHLAAQVDWDAWFHAAGPPPALAPLDSALDDRLATALSRCLSLDLAAFAALSPPDLKIALLDRLLRAEPAPDLLAALDDAFRLSVSPNAELRFRFAKLLLAAGLDKGVFVATDMATKVGRMKFVRPLYKALLRADIPKARNAALLTFQAHQHFYHPICRKMLAADLGLLPPPGDPPRRALFSLALGAALLFVGASLALRASRSV